MPGISVIILGKFSEASRTFRDALLPDFDGIYIFLDPTAALNDLPFVIKGTTAPPSVTDDSTTGTDTDTDHTIHKPSPPKAIVVASPVYDDAFLESARQILLANDAHVPFLKPDWDNNNAAAASDAPATTTTTTTTTAAAAAAAAVPDPQAVKHAAERATKALKKLHEEGKLDGDDDGVYPY
ncbi:uncharacterized protein F4812DRAFT_464165 [Daldinia caldariorum]|uniref:uncharacterized protein n=1 Tax=Daldinia caldariorum TaxID=326644 RepID=UPI0020082461|nr:uncharacterized protein F4812DRAFT_464165 [Daldinia caldariorum]KAI1463049.1 hypothetical protein F4812DRAFT_464165 [Daldinia caldariorum]